MRSAVMRKANQDKQQNQTTVATNINYNQNFVQLKKTFSKVKNASKNEAKQNNLNITIKICEHTIIKLGNN